MTQASIGHHCPECVASQGQRVYTPRDLTQQRPPVTTALIVANVVTFLGQMLSADRLTVWGLLFGPEVADGELWRVLTSGFLHGGLLHIGFNMYALWIFGPTLERGVGTLRFALMYLAGLLGGSVAVLLFDFGQPTLGASGAVLGLAGALSAVLWVRGINIFRTSLAGILVLNLALPLLVGGISFWGHFGGIAAGFVAGLFLSWLPERGGLTQNNAVAATVAWCALLFTLSITLVPGLST